VCACAAFFRLISFVSSTCNARPRRFIREFHATSDDVGDVIGGSIDTGKSRWRRHCTAAAAGTIVVFTMRV
jgi:hypothetical protein